MSFVRNYLTVSIYVIVILFFKHIFVLLKFPTGYFLFRITYPHIVFFITCIIIRKNNDIYLGSINFDIAFSNSSSSSF